MPTKFFIKIENTTAINALATWSPTDAQLGEDTDIAQHAPFNHLTVYNLSDKDIEIRLYGENITDKGVEFLPAGSALVFDQADDIKYYRPYIYNRNATLQIAVNKIILEIRKVT